MKNRILFLGTGVLLMFSSCGGESSHASTSGQAAPLPPLPPPLNDAQMSQALHTLQSLSALQGIAESTQNRHAPESVNSILDAGPDTPGEYVGLNPNQERLSDQADISGVCQVSVEPPPGYDPKNMWDQPPMDGTYHWGMAGSACPIAGTETLTVTTQSTTNESTQTSTTTNSQTDKRIYTINLPQDLQLNDVSAYQMTVQHIYQETWSLISTHSNTFGETTQVQGSLQSQSLGPIPFTGTGTVSSSQTNSTVTFQFPGFVAQVDMTKIGQEPDKNVTFTINGVTLTDAQIANLGAGPTHSGLMSKLQFRR